MCGMNTKRNTGSVRTQALKRAAAVRRERLAAVMEREDAIASAVAAFVEGQARAEQAVTGAEERAAKARADGEQKANRHRQAAAQAVAQLRRLGQTRAQIAGLCGVSPATVRAMLASLTDDNDATTTANREPGHATMTVAPLRASTDRSGANRIGLDDSGGGG